MLEDRTYMRRRSFTPRWSMTLLLVIANAAAFILQSLIASAAPKMLVNTALSVAGLSHGYVWQLLTFQFMHSGWIHLLLNCLAIYMFGREVEEALGRKGFLTLYFSGGILGGLLQLGYSRLLAWLTNRPEFLATHVVGASAGAFGLIAAFAMLYPERPLMLLLIPVQMRAKFLLLFE